MANGSIESKSESNVWPSDDSAQTQHHQDPGTTGRFNENIQVASRLTPFPQPRPPSPVSVVELQERAVQDSQNNNVDENSNDHHHDHYAAAGAAAGVYHGWDTSFQPAYLSREIPHFAFSNQESPSHSSNLSQDISRISYFNRNDSSHLNRETSQHRRETTHHPDLTQDPPSQHFHSSHSSQDLSYPTNHAHSSWENASRLDQSVRPRVRQSSQYHRDEPDRTPLLQQPAITRRDSFGSNSSWQHDGLKHRRNHSEGATRYPPLPNLNCPSYESRNLPSHRGYEPGSNNPHGLLPLTAREGEYKAHLPVAVRSTERVTQEAEELLTTFTSETLRNNRLEVPQWMVTIPSPQMVRAGQELRLLADAFACTPERRKVRVMAESVNLGCIEMDDFFHLCAELFYDGITRERIVALFTFVGDVAVHQVKLKGEQLIQRLMKWSLRYLVDHVCRWVQEAGGWIAVLTCGVNFLYRCAVFVFCICGSVAAGLFIYKTLKNG